MTISVVIATYNRSNVLQKAIDAYNRQVVPPGEVIVVDDGSSDGTETQVAELTGQCVFRLRYFAQHHRGAAAARNIGIREAVGEIILFADDDIIPAPNLVAEHQVSHQQHPEPWTAILGYMTWDPEVHATPFMEWFQDRGPLLGLRGLRREQELDFFQFFTGNLSLKTDYLRQKGLFDEDFDAYGWEDLELGYRLNKKGLRLLYNPDAIGYHHKRVSFADACRRARQTQKTRRILETKEAGQYLRRLEAQQETLWKTRIRRALAHRLVPFLLPLKSLLDSRVRLPDSLYRAFYYYCASSNHRAKTGDWDAA